MIEGFLWIFAIFKRDFFSRRFQITDHAGIEVGRVSKEWDNLPKELLATSDNFGVSFPEEIPAAHKALLIGVALILVSSRRTRSANSNGSGIY